VAVDDADLEFGVAVMPARIADFLGRFMNGSSEFAVRGPPVGKQT
jgi:hypothetical protein